MQSEVVRDDITLAGRWLGALRDSFKFRDNACDQLVLSALHNQRIEETLRQYF